MRMSKEVKASLSAKSILTSVSIATPRRTLEETKPLSEGWDLSIFKVICETCSSQIQSVSLQRPLQRRERDGVPREKGKADIGKDENKPYKNGRAKAEQHRKLRGLGCPRDCLNFCLLCASGDCSIWNAIVIKCYANVDLWFGALL